MTDAARLSELRADIAELDAAINERIDALSVGLSASGVVAAAMHDKRLRALNTARGLLVNEAAEVELYIAARADTGFSDYLLSKVPA